ncbi:electron transfer flavoprotein subunit beta/FixA family protein [uncultured Demequina sp.]|uniref:electron transfer flavoprotein subunit beta/FixA family protein n=1 Tax=uncultured Demequina sp. TaxID=693499 RepID=UPI0025D8765F|nr:electron transfer flavoprotein subunit beta/FixA family protein [uncultured Demequina sp.]
MRIVVLMKVVPDTWVERTLSLETGLAVRTPEDAVLDEINERALEVALAYADEAPETTVTVVAMAPKSVQSALRKAVAMGAHDAVQIIDDRLVGADLILTARVLAAASQHLGFDLIVAGDSSTDGGGGGVPVAIAETLGIAAATHLTQVELNEDSLTGVRASDAAAMHVTADLPAIISITEALPDARLPNFKGILAAKKKEIIELTLDQLGIDADPGAAPATIMIGARERPPREAGTTIVDEGDAGAQLAAFLVENRLA